MRVFPADLSASCGAPFFNSIVRIGDRIVLILHAPDRFQDDSAVVQLSLVSNPAYNARPETEFERKKDLCIDVLNC